MDGLLLVAVQGAECLNHQLLGFGQPDRPLWIICQPQEVVGAGGLTAGLADTLIDRVYIYPNNQVEIVWKMKDFCMSYTW